MAVFSYKIKTKDGKVTKGTLSVESKEKAVEYFHSQGSIVYSLTETKTARKRGKIKTDELVIFSRQLTTLIESGIPIVAALDILIKQVDNLYFRTVVGNISQDLKEGTSFAASLTKHPKVFPEIYVSMVEAAETSGNLPMILDRLSGYLEKMSMLRKKISSSLIYPALIVIMTVTLTSFLLLKIIPIFKNLYESLGAELPAITNMLITASDIVRNNFLVVFLIIGGLIFLFKKYVSTPSGKKVYHKFLLRLPILGDIFKKISIAKFSRTFATLIRSGVDITTAFDIVGKTSGNKMIDEAMLKAKKAVQEGSPLFKPLEESGIFPPMVVKMIAVGEQTGKLEQMLSKIAEFYETQTDAIIAGLASIIEPILIVVIGIVVGIIVVALFLPIITISQVLLRK
ncbi:MAG: type II secretion system F family protein [Candidatus Omnitrophota bacterium]